MNSLPHNQPNGAAGDDGGLEPTTSSSPSKGRSFRAGVAAGCIGLVALVAGTTSLASAESPTLDQAASGETSSTAANVVLSQGIVDDESWQAYDSCIETHLADAGFDEEGFIVEFELDADTAIEEFSSDDFDDAELDAELEAFDAIFESADETCSAELPEGLRAELAAQDEEWEAFELCLGGQFEALEVESTDEVHGIETGVWVSDGDSESFVIFGDDAGSVTISGNVEDLTIDGSGVEVLEGDELDALFDADPYDDVEDDVDH